MSRASSNWTQQIAQHARYVAVQSAAQAAERERIANKIAQLRGTPPPATSNKARVLALFTTARRWRAREIAAAIPALTVNQIKAALSVLMAEGALRSTHRGTQRTEYYNPTHEEEAES